MIAALVWDAGGTLFDTYPAVVAAAQKALAELGVGSEGRAWSSMLDSRCGMRASSPATSSARLMALFRARTRSALQTLAQTYAIPYEVLRERFERIYEAVGPECQPPFPYVSEVCRWVSTRGGLNLIVTHRGRVSLESLLEAHDLRQYFSDWITKEDPYPRKPDPASTLALMDRYDLVPRCCLSIGDRRLDILAGSRAGTLTCFYGDSSEAVLEADLQVTGFDELLRWLDTDRRCDALAVRSTIENN